MSVKRAGNDFRERKEAGRDKKGQSRSPRRRYCGERVYGGKAQLRSGKRVLGFGGGTSPTCIRSWGGILLLTD